ncbi:MAG: hypothetical protein ACOYVK_11370 [Bacillota bacterium]
MAVALTSYEMKIGKREGVVNPCTVNVPKAYPVLRNMEISEIEILDLAPVIIVIFIKPE